MTTLEQVRKRAEADAKTYGYYLTPQSDLLQMFIEGLKTNEDRYGYPSCPCRLATSNLEIDPDVAEYGACYCRLYINKAVFESQNLPEVPERRPAEKMERAYGVQVAAPKVSALQTLGAPETPKAPPSAQKTEVKKKLWYCKQCGYVVYREDPPYVCPVSLFHQLSVLNSTLFHRGIC